MGIFSVGLLGVIIYFAFSSKSSRHLKIAAFIAMGLIALAVAINAIFLFIGPSESEDFIPIPIFQESTATTTDNGNVVGTVVLLLFFVLMIGLIYVLYNKEHKQRDKKGPTGNDIKKSQSSRNMWDK